MQPDIATALAAIREVDTREPTLAAVLGSGLGGLADIVENSTSIDTRDVPGFPRSTVEGHRGRIVIGEISDQCVVMLRGRVHLYEGHPIRSVTFPIRVLHALGARRLIVTNAAGSTNKSNGPGTLMFITDHINMAFANPLSGPNVDGGPRFVDMSEPYDLAWIEEAERAALSEHIPTRRGVYLWTMGPSYETRAEIQAYRRIGADAVGMSTVPEVLQARYLGMKVLGISTITNLAAGLSDQHLSHDDVLAVGETIRGDLIRLIRRIMQR